MEGTYKIYPGDELMVYSVKGLPNLKDVLHLYKEICRDSDFRGDYNGLADWRAAEPNLRRREVKGIARVVTSQRLLSGTWVALVNAPQMTAFAYLYQDAVEQQHPLFVCSTTERASRLLHCNVGDFLP